ncbi:hypothetical protein OSTOST_14679, partial [Ostertagia ostertagi]
TRHRSVRGLCFDVLFGKVLVNLSVQCLLDQNRSSTRLGGSREPVGDGWHADIHAAAAHIVLDKAESTIKRDQANAKKLASGINAITPEKFKHTIHAPDVGNTNIVILECCNGLSPTQVQKFFESRGVLMMVFDATRVRIVLNWGVTEEDVEKVLNHYKDFVRSLSNS